MMVYSSTSHHATHSSNQINQISWILEITFISYKKMDYSHYEMHHYKARCGFIIFTQIIFIPYKPIP